MFRNYNCNDEVVSIEKDKSMFTVTATNICGKYRAHAHNVNERWTVEEIIEALLFKGYLKRNGTGYVAYFGDAVSNFVENCFCEYEPNWAESLKDEPDEFAGVPEWRWYVALGEAKDDFIDDASKAFYESVFDNDNRVTANPAKRIADELKQVRREVSEGKWALKEESVLG
jgi:hypothetical protein